MSASSSSPTTAATRNNELPKISIHGVVPPLVTPFTESFDIDVDALSRQARRLIDAGVDGLFALGSSAEAAFLTRDQRKTVVSTVAAVARNANRKVPVFAGVIDMTTPRVLEHVHDAVAAGAEGIVATAPFYVRTHVNEIARHFRLLHESIPDLPLIAYNIPVSVQVTLDISMLIQLADEGVLSGVKDSGGVDGYTRNLILARNRAGISPDRFGILTGSETTVDMAYLAGADGVVPGLGNVDPYSYVELAAALRAGDYQKAKSIQEQLIDLFDIVFVGDPARMGGSSSGLGGFKAALEHLGVFPSRRMAPPHEPLDDAEVARICEIVDRANIRDCN